MTPGVALVNGERGLEDEIFHLQKLELDSAVRQVVEEAAQLFGEGRHMEAGALIEKAQAMRAVAGSKEPPPADSGNGHRTEAFLQRAAENVVADLVGNLAKGLAEVLVGAIRGLETHIAAETRALGSSFQQQLDRLQTSVDDLLELKGRIDRLTEIVVEQKLVNASAQQRYEHLAAASESLRQADERRDAEVRDLRGELQQFSSSVSERLDAVCSRVGVQQEELAAVQSSVSGASPRVAALVERLDRQANAIRSICEGQNLHETALDEVVGVLSRLQASKPAPAIPADQL